MNIDAERAAFEFEHCGNNKQIVRRNEQGDYVLPSVQDAWAGWQSCARRSASPDLLEALQIADRFCGSLTSDVCPDDVHIPIRAAIAAWNRRSAAIGEGGLPPLPKQPEELRAFWKCEDCDGRGHDGEAHWQGHFQPPEPEPCGTCQGSGWVECEALLPEQASQYARDVVVADRRARSSARSHEKTAETRMDTGFHASARLGEQPPQAAQGVKTWQERCGITRKPEGLVERAMVAEIAELRAQLAATTENLQTAVQEAWKANAELSKLRAAPPLSSEQQDKKGAE